MRWREGEWARNRCGGFESGDGEGTVDEN